MIEFLLYLTPHAREVLSEVYKANYRVVENINFCRKNTDLFGYADLDKNFVICTKNIKKSGYDLKHYVSETVIHEAVHVGHMCNDYRPFGILSKDMPLPSNKIQDIKNSMGASVKSDKNYKMEHEAYWMEDKPEKVKYVLKKYCESKTK